MDNVGLITVGLLPCLGMMGLYAVTHGHAPMMNARLGQ